jgi:ferrochelatase
MHPPLGPTVFYLRSVAPPELTTKHIYLGVIPFIAIQLLALDRAVVRTAACHHTAGGAVRGKAGMIPSVNGFRTRSCPTKEVAGLCLDSAGTAGEAIATMSSENLPSATTEAMSSQERVGVLLVNLGTPDTPDARGVRVYLREFLSDRRVIEDQGLIWKLILNCIILAVRPPRKARDYQKIWNTEKNESPLKTITRSQAEKLGQSLEDSQIVVDWAMRYGNPSIRERMQALIARGCGRMLIVPLYPQYSASTTATVCDEVSRVMQELRAQPAIRFVPPYPTDATYIDALASSINAHLAALPFKPEIIVVSFHGMPQKYIDKGDPYYAQCVATTETLRARLGLDEERLLLTFQSRFGFDEWLQPYTDKTIEGLAKSGLRKMAVVTPGFAADCLETLEEIAQENAEIFRHNGGEQFAFIPCLNDSDAGMDVIRQLVMRELQGWI